VIQRSYFLALLLLLGITLVSQLFRTQLELINIALIHMVPIITIALRGNMRATMLITTLSVVLFDLLYVPPQYSFNVHDLIYIWSFILFYVVGYIITLQAQRIHAHEIKTMLLNTLSHDLKTPLSSILGNASLLLSQPKLDATTQHESLSNLYESAQRMDRLIATLLDNARLQHQQTALPKEWCDIEDLVGVAIAEFHSIEKRKRLHVHVDTPMTLFWGDGALLTRLLVNLMDNAFKYSYASRPILLRLSSTPQTIELSLCNSCAPLAQKELDAMFGHFYRLDNTADISGNGIGLAICKEIVQAHTGTIQAYNRHDGICIDVTLPLLRHPIDAIKALS